MRKFHMFNGILLVYGIARIIFLNFDPRMAKATPTQAILLVGTAALFMLGSIAGSLIAISMTRSVQKPEA